MLLVEAQKRPCGAAKTNFYGQDEPLSRLSLAALVVMPRSLRHYIEVAFCGFGEAEFHVQNDLCRTTDAIRRTLFLNGVPLVDLGIQHLGRIRSVPVFGTPLLVACINGSTAKLTICFRLEAFTENCPILSENIW